MKNKILTFFDKSFLLFLLVGALNTVLSLGLQFILYNFFNMGYWFSTAFAFFVASISSFYFNKKYSFKNKDKVWVTAIKFSLVIIVCYLLAYSLARPISHFILISLNLNINMELIDKIAMVIGQIVFTGLNYIGQRFFAFKNKEEFSS